ncbi:hypothetical protein M514_10947 [Trichuris suis]|uniref:Proteasome subunit beta type-3 n=1 Tax=Trichuris suis TaxID=68888 RepID=A0A085LT65_9BILA|nr:hypothetical protein M513_10947 [Trichuris suis]KFD61898.1 hypothetical protein M514_10947 [Trichuris suis]
MDDIMSYNGGLVVAMRGHECVTIGSDLRLGSRFLTIMTDKPKIYQMAPRLFLGIPGLATDAQTVVDKMHFRTNAYKLREGREVRPKVLTRMVSNLLYEHRFGPYFCEPVVAGLDPYNNYEPYIAVMDLIGYVTAPEDFVTSGSGEMQLFALCENFWEKNMDEDALFEVTAQALLSALDRDASSGWGAVVYTITKSAFSLHRKTMAVNVDRSPDGRGVILYNGEIVLIYTKEVTLDLSSNEQLLRGKTKGALYLTSHRILFTAKNPKDRLQSLSMPFHCLRDVKLEQPVLGANYLHGVLLAQPNGNWTGEATFKLTFHLGGCIDFGLTMLHAVELARQIHTYASPPPYAPPPGDFFSPPPAYYTCQGTNFYGINIPVQTFPDGPPPGNVYVYSAAPPFTGVFSGQPGGVFVPPQAPMGNPPPYSAAVPPYPVQQNGIPGQQAGQQIPNQGTYEVNAPKSNLPSYDDALRRRR